MSGCSSINTGLIKGFGEANSSKSKALKRALRDAERQGRKICFGGNCTYGSCSYFMSEYSVEYERNTDDPNGKRHRVTVEATGECICD